MNIPRLPGPVELLLLNPLRPPAVVNYGTRCALRALVRHAAAHVPVYRDLWRSAGVSADRIRGVADLSLLPMVDKDLLAPAGSAAWDERAVPPRLDSMRTSGTSGRAIQIVRTRRELGVTRRAILRQFLWLGMRPWHRVLTMASGWLKTRRGPIVEHLVTTRHLEPDTPLEEQIRVLEQFAPAALVGQTGGMYLLARELLRRGRRYPLRWVVPTGATLMPGMRQAMRDAFGAEPCDMYGAIEVGPIAWQCRRGGYHLDADRLIVEIVDEAGRPLPPGVSGQVVVTNLYAWTMPFIRYRLQDIAVRASTLCGCGCRFPLLGPVQGRINDFLPTPSGELVSPHFFFHLFDDVANPVKDWRIVQESAGRLRYEYVPEAHFDPAALARGLERVQNRFGTTCVIESRAVETLPLTATGKRQCIVSRLRPAERRREAVWLGPEADAARAAVEARSPHSVATGDHG